MSSPGGSQPTSGTFMRTLKEKTARRSTRETAGSPDSPLIKKTSLFGLFLRKPSEDSQSMDRESKEDDAGPPLSPILSDRKSAVGKHPIARSSPLRRSDQSIGVPASPIPIPSKQTPVGVKAGSPPSNSESPSFKPSRPSLAALARRVSRLSIGSLEADSDFRERSASVTSVDSVYGRRQGNEPVSFEVTNPLHGAGRSNPGQTPLNSRLQDADFEHEQAKKDSLYASAGSHVDQSKLLGRRNTRMGQLNIESPRNASATRASASEFEEPFPMDMYSPLPTPSSKKPSTTASTSSRNSSATSGCDTPSMSRHEASNSASSQEPSPFSSSKRSLRQKRADSKLLHDRNNYSNNVLSNVPDAVSSRIRKAELQAFFESLPRPPAPIKGKDRATYLIERYKAEDLAVPLYSLYACLPAGWDELVPLEIRLRVRQARPGLTSPRTNHGGLENNIKQLMGESTFVASDQIARFQRVQLKQNSGIK